MSARIRTVLFRKVTIILASILLIGCVAITTFAFPSFHANAAGSCVPTQTISYGSTGSLVLLLQRDLNAGYQFHYFPNSPYNFHPYLAEDGIFGSNTQAAVKDFQTKYKSQVRYVDGIVGPLTWAAIFNSGIDACTHL